MSEASEAAKVT